MVSAVAMVVVRVASGPRFRRKRALLIFSGLENETKNTCSEHEYHCKNSDFH
jgi:hypothetical protein